MCVHVCEHCALARGAAQVRIASINVLVEALEQFALLRNVLNLWRMHAQKLLSL
jgi:sulfur relay (sulfurtransferase) complex TusBCD TusD component (DsrE family)